mmetsp:Transcript_36685/g.97113  ORF Transcript_36685/g.97113 Transcript_36685/m.97113 type:complete len:148 (+) Transcript_36685:244-687(+)
MGMHMDLQTCHEFPSVIDPGSERHALEFKEVMDATPADLKTWPANIYSQIAIAIKGGALREPGLANLAQRLAVRVPLKPVAEDSSVLQQSNSKLSLLVSSIAPLYKSSRNVIGAERAGSRRQTRYTHSSRSRDSSTLPASVQELSSC